MDYKKIISVLTIVFVMFAFTDASAQQRKKVGLVLGGGGAKGAAEVGVMKVLEEAKIPVDYIVGTSIGSIVGGMYSIGYDSKMLDSLFRTQDWVFLLSDQVKRTSMSAFSKAEREKYLLRVPLSIKQTTPITAGLVTGQNIYNLFSNMTVGYHNVKSFNDLPIPFACIAVDIVSGKEVVLNSGSLPLAMRSSMSIPGVFSPVEMGDKLLVDGGALNNFPTDVVKKMGADIIIGIDLTTGWKKKDDLSSLPNVVSQLINIMGENKYLQNKKKPDLYINPALKGYGPASFQREAIDSMIVRGEQAARAKWGEILALRRRIYAGCKDTTFVERPVKKALASQQPFAIDSVKMEGVTSDEQAWIRKKIKLADHSNITLGEIEQAISFLQGLDIFSSVEYKMSDTTPCNLTFLLKEKDYKSINLGFRFDTEDVASILVNMSNEKRLDSNHHFSATLRLSKSPYFELGYRYGNYFNPKFGVSYLLGYSDYKLYSHREKVDVLNYLTQSISAYLMRSLSDFRFQLGVRYDHYHFEDQLYDTAYKGIEHNKKNYLNYFTDLALDTYDDRYYPMKGGRIDVQGTLYTNNGATYRGHSPFFAASVNMQKALRLSRTLYLLPALKGRFIFGDSIACIYQNYAGGVYDGKHLPQEMSWETALYTHILKNTFLAGRLGLRYMLGEKIFVTAIGEYGKESMHLSTLPSGHDLWGCALRASYNFILGPVGIQVNYSNLYKNLGVYINAGLYF
jgi:NTE family protein